MSLHVDTLIIGSGVAGVAVASKLLAKDPNASILFLEAGPRVEMKNFRMWQDFVVTGVKPYDFCQDEPYPSRDQPGENQPLGDTVLPLQGSRLLTYGGSTVHWGGWSFRLKPEDFKLNTLANEGLDWPFEYEAFEPYYCEAERFIGVAGDSEDPTTPRSQPYPFRAYPYTLEDQPVIEAMQSKGIAYSHLPIARHGFSDASAAQAPCQTTGTCKYCPFGARFVAGNTLDNLMDWEQHPNLSVRDNAVVHELIMASKNQVSGVRFLDRMTNELVEVRAHRVVLAAGAVESPKPLMRSKGGGWTHGVGNDHDLVGRHFITHPYFMLQAQVKSNPLRLMTEMDFPTLVSRHYDSPEEQAKGKFVLLHPAASPSVPIASMMKAGKSRAEIDAAIEGPQTVLLHGMVETFPRYENRIKELEGKVNQFGLPQTVVEYNRDPEFDGRMQEIVDAAAEIFEAMGAEGTSIQHISWRADHAACTVRMGRDATEGVVDANLKVFGVDNLWVCSNGCFPNLGAINPTLTLAALALRLGEHLAGGEA